MKEWYSLKQLSGVAGLPVSPSNLTAKAKREQWKSRPRKGKGGGNEYHVASLPDATQVSLVKAEAPQKAKTKPKKAAFSYCAQSVWQRYDSVSDAMKTQAQTRVKAVQLYEQLYWQDEPKTIAAEQAAAEYGTTKSSIYRWYKSVRLADRADWAALLVSGYTGRSKEADFDEPAWDFFKADYLRLEKPSIRECYERLIRTAVDQRWSVPCVRTVERWADKRIKTTIKVLKREGEIALMARYPAIERSVADLHALEAINGDGYQHNVFIKWPDGTIDRPKTWFWQDIYSRKILSYRVDKTENTDSIRLSFGDLVEQFGIPEHVTIDNTRAAANKWMTGGVKNRYRFKVKEDDPMGIFCLIGIKPENIHWTSVNKAGTQAKGHGQAKPIERAFGVGGIGGYVDKHPDFVGAYTGENTTAKPENYGETAVPLEVFVRTLNEEIIAWNAREKRRTEMAFGQLSFNEAFKRSYETSVIKKATESQRRLWLLAAESITVKPDGTFTLAAGSKTGQGAAGRNRYHSETLLEYGERKQKIVVRFEPHQLHEKAYAYTLDGRFICDVQCIEAKGFYDNAHSRIHNKARRQFIKANKMAADAEIRMDLADVSSLMTRPDLPTDVNAKIVRPAQPLITDAVAKPPQQDPAMVARANAQNLHLIKPKTVAQAPTDIGTKYTQWEAVGEQIQRGEITDKQQIEAYQRWMNSDSYKSHKRFLESFGLASAN